MNRSRGNFRIVLLCLLALTVVVAFVSMRPPKRGAKATAPRRTQTAARVATPTPTPAATPTPAPSPTPEEFGRHAIAFRRSGAPATQTIARFGDGIGERTDDSGTIARRDGAVSLEIVDIPTSLTLARFATTPQRARIDVPEPIRVVGRVLDDSAKPASAATLRLGHGPRELAADRHRRRTHSKVTRAPNEDTPWGVAMPESSSLWTELDVSGSGDFESSWIVADAPPQLVAFDAEGRVAVADVALPRDLAPRSDVRAELRLAPPTGLDIEVEFPPDMDPFPIAIGFADAELDPDRAEESALILSALDAANPDLARFAIGQGNVFVAGPGVRRIAPLPPMRRATIVARGATSALLPKRDIEIPFGEIVHLRFERRELFPVVERRVRFEGRLALQGTGVPVNDAVVVAGWFGGKLETTTDADGRFAFAAMPADQELRFLVQAYDDAQPPRWSHAMEKNFDALADDPTVVAWEIPGLWWLTVDGVESTEGQPPLVSLEVQDASGLWQPWRGVADFYFAENAVEIELPEPNAWRAVVQQSDFVFRCSDEATLGGDAIEANVALRDAEGLRETATIVVRRRDGTPAFGAPVFLTPQYPGARPVEIVANREGEVVLGPLNIDRVGVRLDGESEAFEGVVDLTAGMAEIRLEVPR